MISGCWAHIKPVKRARGDIRFARHLFKRTLGSPSFVIRVLFAQSDVRRLSAGSQQGGRRSPTFDYDALHSHIMA